MSAGAPDSVSEVLEDAAKVSHELSSLPLDKLHVFMRDLALGQNREYVPDKTWTSVEVVSERLVLEPLTAPVCQVSAEFFRFLRNAFSGCPYSAEAVLCRKKLLHNVDHLIRALMEQRSKDPTVKDVTVALRCGVQCLGNLVVSWSSAKERIWSLTFGGNGSIYPVLLSSDDSMVRMYASMLLHVCCLNPSVLLCLFWSRTAAEVVTSLARMMTDTESEWSLFLLELFLTHENSPDIFDKLPGQERLVVLDVAVEQVQKKGSRAVHAQFLHHLCTLLRMKLEEIQALPGRFEEGKLEPVQVSKMLSVLCEAACNDNYSELIQPEGGLLKAALGVLKAVHLLGKSGNNAFTPAPRLDDLVKADQESSDDVNPGRNFKKDLVRLIGNMSHRCAYNQDLVRKAEGIPLLLDVCNLDAKNPFIIQWVILAIRNLLEDNWDNQTLVARMVHKGLAMDETQLREMGVRLDILSQFENRKPTSSPE